MRVRSILPLLVLAVACRVQVPRPGDIGISVKVTTRVEARVQPAPETIVAIQGAPVVEFFGIPLEGAQDVVFVLDVSGSMSERAQGRLAQIQVANDPPPAAPTTTPASTAPPETPPDPQQAPETWQPPTSPDQPPPPPDQPPPPDWQPQPPPDPQPPPPAAPPPPRKIDVAQVELVDALERLPAGTRMNVVFFNSGIEAFAATLVPLADPDRPGMITFVKSTIPAGSTALAPALRTAFLMNARRIVLLSDGLGNVGGSSEAVLRDAREAMRGGVRIDTIGLGYAQDRALLETLARESGGLYQGL